MFCPKIRVFFVPSLQGNLTSGRTPKCRILYPRFLPEIRVFHVSESISKTEVDSRNSFTLKDHILDICTYFGKRDLYLYMTLPWDNLMSAHITIELNEGLNNSQNYFNTNLAKKNSLT